MKNVNMKNVNQGLEKAPSQRLMDKINRLGYLIEIGVTERAPLDYLMREFRDIQVAVADQEREIDTYRVGVVMSVSRKNPFRPLTKSSDDFIGGAI